MCGKHYPLSHSLAPYNHLHPHLVPCCQLCSLSRRKDSSRLLLDALTEGSHQLKAEFSEFIDPSTLSCVLFLHLKHSIFLEGVELQATATQPQRLYNQALSCQEVWNLHLRRRSPSSQAPASLAPPLRARDPLSQAPGTAVGPPGRKWRKDKR